MISLQSVYIENVPGFYEAKKKIDFDENKITCITGESKTSLLRVFKFVQLACKVGFETASKSYRIDYNRTCPHRFDTTFSFNNGTTFRLAVDSSVRTLETIRQALDDDKSKEVMDEDGFFNGDRINNVPVQNGQLALSAHGRFKNNVAESILSYFTNIHDVHSSDFFLVDYDDLLDYFDKIFPYPKSTGIIYHLENNNNQVCDDWSNKDKLIVRVGMSLTSKYKPSLILIDDIDTYITFETLEDLSFLYKLKEFENQIIITARHSSAIKNIYKMLYGDVVSLDLQT